VFNPASVLADLRDHLGFRRIGAGYRMLDDLEPQLDELSAGQPAAGVLVGLAGQWVDAGWSSPQRLSSLLDRFPRQRRGSLPLVDYLHVRMAEGVIAMQAEDFEAACTHFRFVHALEGEACDPELLAIASFWTGRCLRRMGQYDDAVNYTARGEELALACGYGPMAAIMQSTLSWLAFQKGKLSEALVLLRRAEEALDQTDDYLNRGNVKSAYGRIARRQGRYEHAVNCFEAAIEEYRRGGGGQAQLGRALSNLAFVKRVLALELQKDLDRMAASRRAGREDASEAGTLMRDQRLRIERTRTEARQHLAESLAIYGPLHNHHGIAGVHINSGFLHLDEGELDLASADAVEAFRFGEEKRDSIIMARARTLQCIIEHEALEEQLGDAAEHFHAADTYAREAVHFAGQTQDSRLLARAYIWHGLTIARDPSAEKEAAHHCYETANELLQGLSLDQRRSWDDLERLKGHVIRTRPIEPALRAWSAGVTGDKSFQEIEEEFARIVIPRVWEREGRKISRVAGKLSISPKKVRRILHSIGLLERADSDSTED
jgi:tetratricopeptide (TPR) repeat protein